jgi:membrane protease YdiL (CAAX protease family)
VIREPLAVDPDGSPTLDGDVADLAASVETPPVRSGLHVAVFAALAFALSWAAWLPLVVQHEGWARVGASPYLHLVGSLGPAVAAFVVTSVVDGRAGLRLLLGRMWRGPPRLFAVALGGPAAVYLVAVVVAAIAGIDVDLGVTGASTEFATLPLVAFWAANLVFYGYGEEVGWRGFALPRLQRGRSALAASMILAVLWAAWHLPLFFFSGTLSTMPPVGIIGWAASIVTGSVLCAWLFNTSRGSVAVVALFHAALDIFFTSPTGGDIVPNVMGAAVVAAALLIPRIYGRADLAPTPKVTTTQPTPSGSVASSSASWGSLGNA